MDAVNIRDLEPTTAQNAAAFPKHPILSSLYDPVWIAGCERKFRSAPNQMYNCLCDGSTQRVVLLDDLESLMRCGIDIGILDNKMRGQLRALDEVAWLSAIAELECADVLGRAGLRIVSNPPGRAGTFGDFQVGSHPPLFVEVKALFDNPERMLHRKVRRKLWNSTRVVGREVGASCHVHFGHVRNLADFSGTSFQKFLRQQLTTHPNSFTFKFVYRDHSGLVVDATVQPRAPGKSTAPSGPWQGLWGNLNESYKKAVGKSLRQLPDDKPSLLVFRPWLSFPLDEKDVRDLVAWCFQAKARTRISALGMLSDGKESRTLTLYTNPHAMVTLPKEVSSSECFEINGADGT